MVYITENHINFFETHYKLIIVDSTRYIRYISYVILSVLQVVMDNGIIKVTLTNPSGSIAGIQFNGVKNLLNDSKKQEYRG